MIVTIMGTSGAGKSTVVRGVMEQFDLVDPVFVADRKRPIGYVCSQSLVAGRALFVVGHYETPCGGCDTIVGNNTIFDLILSHAVRGHDVLFEGVIIQDSVQRYIDIAWDWPFAAVVLTTPVEQCLAGVLERRAANGNERVLNPKNTVQRAKRIQKHVDRLKELGVDVRRATREDAARLCLQLLRYGFNDEATTC